MTKPHVAVIGAGIGGLSAAVALCKRGINTTVIEQHHCCGGKMHQTTVNGNSVDSGPTVFTMRHVFDNLLRGSGQSLDHIVNLQPLDILARHFWQDSPTLDLFTSVEQTCQAIEQFASSDDADNYRRFAKESESLFNALDRNFMQADKHGTLQLASSAGRDLLTIAKSNPFQSLWSALGKRFKDPRLQQLFARYSTYCGSSPFKSPATLMLIAHAERAGVWTLRDGMHTLAAALEQLASSLGADFRYNTRVEKIDSNADKITGLSLADGSSVKADAVIFNGDITALHDTLLDRPQAGLKNRFNLTTKQRGRSLSAITMCTVTKPVITPLSYHNVFFNQEYRREFDCIFSNNTISEHPTIYVCAQDRLQPHTSNGTERIFCLMNAPATSQSPDYWHKQQLKICQTLALYGLKLDDSQAVYSNPADFDQRFPGRDGALYGMPSHGWRAAFQRPGTRTTIKGLYVAGGSVHPGAGVPMVSLSGQMAADNLVSDFSL